MYTSDKEAIILEYIYFNDSLKQRDLADKAGISLGMVNAILRRLVEKGWIVTRRINSRNISYVVSSSGMEEIFKKGYLDFKKSIDDVQLYKAGIEKLISEAVATGYNTITLVGKSDLDFVVEYICGKAGVTFNNINPDQINDKMFVIYSEKYEVKDKTKKQYWLRTIVLKGENKV